MYSDDEIWICLENAHLKQFVTDLAEGLEYECGEGGESLRCVLKSKPPSPPKKKPQKIT